MLRSVQRRGRRLLTRTIGPRWILPRLPQRTDLAPPVFGLQVGPSGHLHLRSRDLVELVAEYGSPLHVVDGPRLTAAARSALAPFRSPDRLGCDVYYSYKTNPIPGVLRHLHDEGIGAEVISEYELWLALKFGLPGDRIIYNGPAKSDRSLCTAIERQVRIINANSVDEVDRIATAAGRVGRPASIGLRIALPGAWGGQFGIAADLDLVAGLVARIQADDRLRLEGLHMHRGGTIRTADEVAAHAGQILGFVDDLRTRTSWTPDLLDVGGSLACPTVAGFPSREYRLNRLLGSDLLPPDPTEAVTVEEASEQVGTMVATWAAEVGVAMPAVVLEPGRAMTASTQFLLTSVLDVKTDGRLPHAIMDAGINVAEPATSEYHQLFSVSRPDGRPERDYRLAGPICTPADVLYNQWRLPELTAGDVLAIMDTGAYFVPFSTSFSFPRPGIVLCDEDDDVEVIRARESFDDLVRLDGAPWAER